MYDVVNFQYRKHVVIESSISFNWSTKHYLKKQNYILLSIIFFSDYIFH